MKFIFCVLWLFVWLSSPANSIKNLLIGLGEPNSPLLLKSMNFEDEWFVQKLDHFNPTDNRTWKQVGTIYYEINIRINVI